MFRPETTPTDETPEWAETAGPDRKSPARSRALPMCICALLASAQTPTVSAHVVLAQKAAQAGTYYRAQFMVGHGCQGSSTIAVQVEIPDGVPVARPQPKAGWALTYESGPLAEAAMVHGKPKTEGIRRVVWRGGPLPDEQYEEFGMMLFLAKPGRLHFRVLQTCENGANDWAEVARDGGPKPAFPAATLDVTPAVGEGAEHNRHPPASGADANPNHHH